MFVRPHILMLMQRATLRVDKNDAGDRVRVADLALVIEPFPYELAAELDEHLLSHLFTAARQIRPELHDITLDPRADLQRVTVHSAADAPALAELPASEILDLSIVAKTDAEGRAWLKATLGLRIDLSERKVREFLFQHFGEYRLFTFLAEQQTLPIAATSDARASRSH